MSACSVCNTSSYVLGLYGLIICWAPHRALAWDLELLDEDKSAPRIVILKPMFHPDEAKVRAIIHRLVCMEHVQNLWLFNVCVPYALL